MPHALIISDNLAIGHGISRHLADHGFTSFDLAWSRRKAFECALRHRPDLVVAGDTIADDTPMEVAEAIAAPRDLPVLVVTADGCAFRRGRLARATVEGPFALSQLDRALATLEAAA